MNDEHVMLGKELFVTFYKILSCLLPKNTLEKHKI
jgi:hypothetical protein